LKNGKFSSNRASLEELALPVCRLRQWQGLPKSWAGLFVEQVSGSRDGVEKRKDVREYQGVASYIEARQVPFSAL